MITATDIKVTIGGTPILHGVNFEAHPGTVTAIVGPNGSGKSTLIKALTQDIPSTGEMKINGQPVADYAAWELATIRGVLPQASTLAFPFTVVEILRLGLSAGIHGADPHLINRALAMVGLSGYANHHFQDLSGGEQQRAHLARVLCQVWEPVVNRQPRWLLLDEPVASLDIGHQLVVMQCLQDYARKGGGVIAVMHDLNLTAMIADRIAMISDGMIIADGPPGQVLTDSVLSNAYGCTLRTNHVPQNCAGFILPQAAGLIGRTPKTVPTAL